MYTYLALLICLPYLQVGTVDNYLSKHGVYVNAL